MGSYNDTYEVLSSDSSLFPIPFYRILIIFNKCLSRFKIQENSTPGTTPKRKVLGIRGLAKHDSDLKITLKCPGKAVDGME